MEKTARKMTDDPVVQRIVGLIREQGKRPYVSYRDRAGSNAKMEVEWELSLYKINL